ncbi:MAG: hypothetical protein N3G74_00005 [Candidatus Micrarchaeota archaeon]|nr:hypothetical protein [Candidatus Micrarchaeota archaeon]
MDLKTKNNLKDMNNVLNIKMPDEQRKQVVNYLKNISNELNKSEKQMKELGSLFKERIKKSNNKFVSNLNDAIKNNDFSNIKEMISKFAGDNLVKIKAKNMFNELNISGKTHSAFINKGIDEFNKQFSEFISLSIQNNQPTAVLNLSNLTSLADRQKEKKLQEAKIGKIPIRDILDVLDQNNISHINVNQQIVNDLKSKSIISRANGFNNAVNREIINPVKDVKEAANLFVSTLCKQRPADAGMQEETFGKSSVIFNKGPTASSGPIEAYNFSMNFNYSPLAGAGVNLALSGFVVRMNLPKQIPIQKGLNLVTNVSLGAAFVNGDAYLNIGNYSEKLYSIGRTLPVASAELGFNYTPGKDVLFRSGLSLLPGVDTFFKNGKLQLEPTIQSSIFASLSVKI